jgi:hypothetical protein
MPLTATLCASEAPRRAALMPTFKRERHFATSAAPEQSPIRKALLLLMTKAFITGLITLTNRCSEYYHRQANDKYNFAYSRVLFIHPAPPCRTPPWQWAFDSKG